MSKPTYLPLEEDVSDSLLTRELLGPDGPDGQPPPRPLSSAWALKRWGEPGGRLCPSHDLSLSAHRLTYTIKSPRCTICTQHKNPLHTHTHTHTHAHTLNALCTHALCTHALCTLAHMHSAHTQLPSLWQLVRSGQCRLLEKGSQAKAGNRHRQVATGHTSHVMSPISTFCTRHQIASLRQHWHGSDKGPMCAPALRSEQLRFMPAHLNATILVVTACWTANGNG